MQTTNREIMDAYRNISGLEGSVLGQLLYGSSKFRQVHNTIDVRVMGIHDKLTKMREKYFLMVNGQMQFEEVPAEKEGDKPSQKPKFNEGFTQEGYDKEVDELMGTKIEI